MRLSSSSSSTSSILVVVRRRIYDSSHRRTTGSSTATGRCCLYTVGSISNLPQGSLLSSSFSSSSSSDDEYNTSSYHYDMNDKQLAKQDLLYCMNLVKERDYENGYICGLLLPIHTQTAYFALRAWNVEIASIKDSSAIRYHQRRRHNTDDDENDNNDPWNPMNPSSAPPPSIFALQLRMQWWKKAIDVIFHHHHNNNNNNNYNNNNYNTPTSSLESTTTGTTTDTSYWKNPVLRSLHRAMTSPLSQQQCNTSPISQQQQQKPPLLWTKRFMERIMEAREADLYMDQYTTIHDCCTYADETISNLLLLSLECCRGGDGGSEINDTTDQNHLLQVFNNDDNDDIITSAGIGIGLTTLLRATPYRLLASSSSSSSSSSNAQSSLDMPLPSELFQPNFPYHNIVSTYMKENQSADSNHTNTNNVSSSSDDMLPTDIDPTIRLKLQRHIPNDQLSTEEKEQFHMAVHTICDMSQNHLSLVVQKLQQPPQQRRPWSSAEKMCLLSIIPCQNYLYQLQHRYQYDVFQSMKEQQTNQYRVAKDRIQLFYQLGRTYMTGKYY